ncbi:hypothetical protein [Aequorivita sinensis]|uniref:hypothetical protein n=1 Tax=Aequorivita sinensis TaxID=1382458 RepID=UPI0023013E2F|nr:hypothetical protein [Aequorivita sinensis]
MKLKYTLFPSFQVSLFMVLTITFSGFAQNKKQADLVSAYKEYTELPREVGYAHLNKTTYLKGEIMGFTVYVFDKTNKKPSETTTNVYCTISDENNRVVKSEMILAANGIANGSFQIDNYFTSGEYTFKAYTNWMRNFDEQNYYTQTVKIIDLENEDIQKTKISTSKLDAQFLPEGGHFVADVKNSVGVIVKDSLGFGVPNVTGKVLDSKNNTLIDFKTNNLGIGKFTYLPKTRELYKVVLNIDGTEQIFPLEKAENQGIALTLNDLENRVALSLRTNENTLKQLKNKDYTLAIHNGNVLRTVNVNFGKSLEVTKMINYKDLTTGINIFTLFDENSKPILERMFFKYEGIKLLIAQNPQTVDLKDSLTIKIPINNINSTSVNNFSVSVLPGETKSYNPTNNIISETYLQPYIKSYIENAAYYFTDITRSKKFELDNVLLTQGWSSYDWNTVFNHPPKELYEFENGISFRANVNNKTTLEYMMYASINNEMQVFDFDEGDKDFGAVGLYPMDTENIRFSAVKKNNNLERPNLYFQFSPSGIPDLKTIGIQAPLYDETVSKTYIGQKISKSSWENAEQLEEVVIQTNKTLTREDKLSVVPFGKVKVIDDNVRKSNIFLKDYIRQQGFKVFEYMGQLMIFSPRPFTLGQGKTITTAGTLSGTYNTTITTPGVVVYFNDMRLANIDHLSHYTMDDVDYILFDKSGASEAGAGAPGVIKIYTDPTLSQSKMQRNVTQEVSVPLAFSTPKKFYTPGYTSYQSQFYQDYGVIGWFPRLTIQADGNIHFKIPHQLIDHLSVFIEGIANDGSFISERKEINLK